MGDEYHVGMAGAVGPHAKNKGGAFSQTINQAAATIDMKALASELSRLRTEMRAAAVQPEEDEAVAKIGAAETAATLEHRSEALGHLKAAGAWALEIATKIGTTVAAKAIETALKM